MHKIKRRAELILEYEKVMSNTDKKNPHWNPTFLHLLLPKDKVGKGEDEERVVHEWRQTTDMKIEALDRKMDQILGALKQMQAPTQATQS